MCEELVYELNAITGESRQPGVEYERAGLFVDSGASICGCPREHAEGHPRLPKEGVYSYSTANYGSAQNEGGVELVACFQIGEHSKMKFTVMDIKRVIAAVSRFVKSGHKVVFDDEKDGGSYILNKKTKKYYKMYERNGIYEVPIWIRKPAQGLGGSQPRRKTKARRSYISAR